MNQAVDLSSQRVRRAPGARSASENWFESADGVRLFYRYWPAQVHGAERALILFHRGHEHSERLQNLVDKIGLDDFDIFAWDARGHGRSPGARGYAESFGQLEKDADCFVKHVSHSHRIGFENMAILAQSVGSVVVAAWVHDFAPKIRCLVLVSPAFKVKLYVPLARPGLRLLLLLKNPAFVKSYVKAKFLTHDPAQIAAYENDPLISRSIAVNVLLDLQDAGRRLIGDAAAIHTPTQLLISGADWVVRRKPQEKFFAELGSRVKEKHLFAKFYHDTLNEKDGHLPIARAREFILQQFAQPLYCPSLLDADRTGHTKSEYDGLKRPLSPASPKAINFAITKLALRTAGRLSHGIREGLEQGFDSGAALDYVYRHRAACVTAVGKLIDWFYLNSIGWRGIRQRRVHLQRLLREAAISVQQAGCTARFLDIAAGHGRYLLEVLSSLGSNGAMEALLCDYRTENVERGRRLIAEMGLADRARFEVGDAFDRAALARIVPRPNIVIVSGLYELFPDNAPVQTSLAGVADGIAEGGYLIYTNQPWHPQLEMIARALTSHRNGAPWVMRRRSQMEMDQLVEAAGFDKIDQWIDRWGIFTVSAARRMSRGSS
jgi:alpha-beta hydrolase superfamily lysophospholipase/SAM-dependent methyltransferase